MKGEDVMIKNTVFYMKKRWRKALNSLLPCSYFILRFYLNKVSGVKSKHLIWFLS